MIPFEHGLLSWKPLWLDNPLYWPFGIPSIPKQTSVNPLLWADPPRLRVGHPVGKRRINPWWIDGSNNLPRGFAVVRSHFLPPLPRGHHSHGFWYAWSFWNLWDGSYFLVAPMSSPDSDPGLMIPVQVNRMTPPQVSVPEVSSC